MTQIGPRLRHNGENTILGLLSDKDTKEQRTNPKHSKGAKCSWRRRSLFLAEKGLHLIEDDNMYCVFGMMGDDYRSFINHKVFKRVTKHSA